MRLLPLTVLIAIALVAGFVSLNCGGGGDDKVKVKAGEPIELEITPYPTVAGPEGPLPTRTADFAALCQKTDQKHWAEMPPIIIDPDLAYTAVIRTEKGDVSIDLFPDIAPWTVNNFVFLACSGFYDNLTFFTVMPDYVAQAGDPSGRGVSDPVLAGPGYYIPSEISGREFVKGTVAMASRGPDTPPEGSQFFICYKDLPELNGRYAIFGEVVDGFSVLEKLTPRNAQQATTPGDKILEIVIQEG